MGGDATRQDAAQRRRSGDVVGIIRYRGIQSHFTRTGCDLPSCPPVHLFMSTILYKYIAIAVLYVWADVISFWGSKLTPRCVRGLVGAQGCHAWHYQDTSHVRGRQQSQRKENYLVGIYCRVESVQHTQPDFYLSMVGAD